MWRLIGKVDVIITDSPLLLSILYDKKKNKTFRKLVLEQYYQFKNITYFIERSFDYNENGRYQNEDEAKKLDNELLKLLETNDVDFYFGKNDDELRERIIENTLLTLEYTK